MKDKFIFLELLRGMAALAVCLSHLRNFLFIDYINLESPSFLTSLFYFSTSLGHSAVIIFFVISGYLVGGQCYNNFISNKFLFKKYLIDRMVRLWTVLIPALLLTLIIDMIGIRLIESVGYDGYFYNILGSGPITFNDAYNYSISTFIGNLFFLQTILNPIYGSNSPLWSLAYEFWYYLFFPILLFFYLYDKKYKFLYFFSLIFLIIYLFPSDLVIGFIYWLFGFIGYILNRNYLNSGKLFLKFFSLFSFLLFLLIDQFYKTYISHIFLSISTGILILNWNDFSLKSIYLKKIILFFSNISFSLYLIHFPIMAFIFFVFLAPTQYLPIFNSFFIFFIIFFFIIFISFIFWFIFEKRTLLIKKYLYLKLKI